MWSELRGRWKYATGSSGSPTLPKGAQIIGIFMSGSGGTLTINGGDTITMPGSNEWSIRFPHLLVVALTTTPLAFTSTATYFVEYVDPQGSA
jgi:hypothetical protein